MNDRQRQLHALRKDLISLEAGAALAYERVYGQAHRDRTKLSNAEAREAIAYGLADLVTLYSHDAEKTTISALKRADMAGGEFRDGAQRLFFPDGRPQITRLAVRTSDLRPAIESLQTRQVAFDALPKSIGTEPALTRPQA